MWSDGTVYSQSCDDISHMNNAIFMLVTHDLNLILAVLTECFMQSDPRGNESIHETVTNSV